MESTLIEGIILPLQAQGRILTGLRDFLDREGVEGYVVGGYIRDSLLGRDSADVDVAVQGPAPEIAQRVAAALGGSYVLLDEANAIARVVLPEVFLDFSSLRGTIQEDLASRDFTMDAMSVDLKDLGGSTSPVRLIDPFGGQGDVEKKLVRALGDGVFQADPARLLRAVRLAAELGFSIDPGTESLVRTFCYLASRVAGERIQEELLRLLALPGAAGHLRRLDALGLLLVIFPELAPAKGTEQPPEHHWNVFDHSIETVAALETILREISGPVEVVREVPWSEELARHFDRWVGHIPRRALVKLAALLHDVAKPRTKSLDVGRIRFLGHAQDGAAEVVEVMTRLRFSNRAIRLVETMVRHHLRPTQMAQGEEMPSRRAIYRYFRDAEEAALDTLFLSLADHWATRGPTLIPEAWAQHCRLTQYIIEERSRQESQVQTPKLVDGHDLMAHFELKPSPRLGQVLEVLKEAQATGEITSREEALAWAEKYLAGEKE